MSTIDWKGNIMCMIFFAGCNFSCPYCHNSEFISMDFGYDVIISQIFEQIVDNFSIVDGIGLSGGEPTIQGKQCIELLRVAKKYNLKTMIETNGSCPDILSAMIDEKIIDFIAMDFKTSPEKYHLVGGEAPIISLELLHKSNIEYEIRTTVCPEIVNDSDLEKIKELLSDDCKWVHQECIQ